MNKRLIVIIITLLFLLVLISRFTELQQLKSVLSNGNSWLVLAAAIVQVGYFVVFAWSYQCAFAAVDIKTRTRDLLPVTLGSLFINVVVPAGGAGGAALFVEDLTKRGKPAARAAAGLLLQLTADFAAFTLLLFPGLYFLYREHDLQAYEIAAAGLLILMTAGLCAILMVGLWKPGWLFKLFEWSRHIANWIFGRLNRSLALAEDWSQKNIAEFQVASSAIGQHPDLLFRTILAALLAHLVDVSALYFLFQAFNQPVGMGVLIAGYSVGVLFLIVSITPQGIGLVEGMMTLVLVSLGIPGAIAAAVALAYRGLTFWIPMLLGFLAVQRMHTVSPNRQTLTETWGVRFVSILVALMGIINVISALTPSLASRIVLLERISPLEVRHGSHLTAALSGFALLLLAQGLGRRKRLAWLTTLAVLVLGIISHLLKGLDYEEAALAGGLIVLLVIMRDHFHARSDRPSIRQGLQVLAAALLFTMVYGVTGFYLLDRHYSINFGLNAAVVQTVVMFTQFYDPGLVPTTTFGRYFADSIYFVGAATLGYAGLMLLRPVFVRSPASADERARAIRIVENYGNTSFARSLLFDDKRYYFSQGGSLVAFTLVGRTAVTLGDPVGPAGDTFASIQEFTSLCVRNDWLPVFYHTMPQTLDFYRQAGFDSIQIGEEAIVKLDSFTLDGKENKHTRSAINKLTKEGYQFAVYEPPISDEILEDLRQISDEWLTNIHGTEKKFSLGWFEDSYIRSSLIAVVLAPEGWISAFANIVTEYQNNEVSIDLMRHRSKIENGTMDYLFVSMFVWAKSKGFSGFNLGLSALYGVGDEEKDPAVEKVMHWIYENVNQFYNFKGLHHFKEKFGPEWSPRYLIYQGALNLAQSWLAVVNANSGSGNVFLDFLEDRKQRKIQSAGS